MSRKKFLIYFLIISIIIAGFIYLCAHLLVLGGIMKERNSKQCVGTFEIKAWNDTLEIAQALCVDAQGDQLEEIRNNYKIQIEKLEGDVKYWKNSFFSLQKEKEEIINP